MLCLTVLLRAKSEGDVDEIRGLLAEQGRLSREEPGCLRFEVYHSQSDSRTFLLVERWESEQALDEHRKARAYTEIYQPRVLPLVEREPHVCTLVE